MPSDTMRRLPFRCSPCSCLAAGRRLAVRGILERHRRDVVRSRRRHAACRGARVPRRPAVGSICSQPRLDPPFGYRHALVAADRRRPRRTVRPVPPIRRRRDGRAADARGLAAAVAAAGDGRRVRRSPGGWPAARPRWSRSLLAVFGLPAFQHFKPGRIDHHNVQIVLALLTVAATVWSDRVRWAGIAAGLLSALALAIGFESLPYIGLSARRWRCVIVVDAHGSCRAGALRLVAGAWRDRAHSSSASGRRIWARGACDAIAINTLRAGRRRRARAWRRAGNWLADFDSRAVLARHCRHCGCRARALRRHRSALPRRAVRGDGSGGEADLARACARDGTAVALDAGNAGHGPVGLGLSGGGAGGGGVAGLHRRRAPRFRIPPRDRRAGDRDCRRPSRW